MSEARRQFHVDPPPASDRASAVLGLPQLLSNCADLQALLRVLAGELAPLLPVRDRVSLTFLDPGGEWMRVYRVLPVAEGDPNPLPRVKVEGTVVGQVARDGIARVVADVRSDRNLTFGHASHDGIRSTVSVPVFVAGRVVGVMNCGSKTVGACHEEMLGEVAELAAVAGPAVFAAERVFLPDAERVREPATEKTAKNAQDLVGQGATFRSLLSQAERAATSDATVLITGETGVGKTALARAIHRWSDRRAKPFVPVHIADLPSTLVESELFGHERGAFTGASARRAGRFELADGGTIFLDEIGEAPLALQSKLLRVLQEGRFERVGGGATIATDVRIIAATNRDLRQAVERGEFRKDLFYRLDILPLHVPPLRERPEDLETLANAIIGRLASQRGRSLKIAPKGWARLRAHGWPGNVRELESVLLRAAVLESGEDLELSGLTAQPAPTPEPSATDWPSRDENERRYISRVLERTGSMIEGARGAAKLLGMQPSTLRSRMKRLGIGARRPGGG